MTDDLQAHAREPQPEPQASVDDMAAAVARQLKTYQDEDAVVVEELDKLKARHKWLSAEIDKAERMTRALVPKTRGRKAAEANPPVVQPQVQTEPAPQAQTPPSEAAPAFRPE